tara:strand:+ start:112 stop:264 length:153 start_codon:yes stop_codon:yes gene_type:complete
MPLIINVKKKLSFSIKIEWQNASFKKAFKLDYFGRVYITRTDCGIYEIIK